MNLFSIIVLIIGILVIVFPNQILMFGRNKIPKEGSQPSRITTYMGRVIGAILIILVLLGKFK